MKQQCQTDLWEGEYGDKYIENSFWSAEEYNTLFEKWIGITRINLNKMFLDDLDRSIKILEIGCNVANQLVLLHQMGFENLHGIEINDIAVLEAQKRTKDMNMQIKKGSILDLPYQDNEFDLVFTSGVLIHISPENISQAMQEIHRCSNKYIWGYENYHKKFISTCPNQTWAEDYSKLYLESFNDLSRVVDDKIYTYKKRKLRVMFLLSKQL